MAVSEERIYDVVIMGGGIAGQFQARHLLLKIPGIRIAMVEPKDEKEILEIDKIGESTVEIAATFAARDLGLIDYLIESQLPKCGLAFHWPKDPNKTNSISDYYSSWPTRNPTLASYQLHRGVIESDLMKMNRDMGVDIWKGKVVDCDLSKGDAPKSCTFELQPSGEQKTIRGRFLIDAAGRAFITGRKTGNTKTGPDNLYGLNNGTSWVRVSGVDRKLFVDGMLGNRACTSQYYVTNHWFGAGHWLWMIPIDGEKGTLSVGVMHHHNVIPAKTVNSKEKLYSFLEANHTALWKLLKDCQVDDFVYMSRPAHISEKMFFEDNWFVIGDAAYIFDAFYSQGVSTISIAVSSVTEIIRAKMAGEPDAEEKRIAYNDFNLWWAHHVVHLYRYHENLLGDASLMSWRIYMEYIWWFGSFVPMFYGMWHLKPKFIREAMANCERHFLKEIYEDMLKAQAAGKNIGFMCTYRADQLPFTDWSPTLEHVHYLENAESDPQRLNIYRSISLTYRKVAIWWLTYQYRTWGIRGLFAPRTLHHLLRLYKQSVKIGLAAFRHDEENRGVPNNKAWAKMTEEFKSYRYDKEPRPWKWERSEKA